MTKILSVFAAILLFGFLILIHEGGHYLFARLFKVKINEFAIGMGPKLVSKVSKKTGIRYSWRAFPIGGYVSMEGEDKDFESKDGFSSKPVWQRMIITVAGALTNIIVGILVMTIIVFATTDRIASRTVADFLDGGTIYSENGSSVYGVLYEAYDDQEQLLSTSSGQTIYVSATTLSSGEKVMTFVRYDLQLNRFRACNQEGEFVADALVFTNKQTPEAPLYEFSDGTQVSISKVILASSCDYGLDGDHDILQAGDEIVAVNHDMTHIYSELSYAILHAALNEESLISICNSNAEVVNYMLSIDLTVIRDGETVELQNVVFPTASNQGIVFGDFCFQVYRESPSFFGVIKQAFYQALSTIRMIWDSLFDLIRGSYGIQALSGPVGVTEQLASAASSGAYEFFYLAVVISMNLGIMNLLPIPALDGGKLFFQLIELVFRKPVKRELESVIHFIGILILLLFMLFITGKDIISLFR